MIFWPKKCKHTFSMWEVIKRASSTDGGYLIVQERRCAVCGLAEVITTWS